MIRVYRFRESQEAVKSALLFLADPEIGAASGGRQSCGWLNAFLLLNNKEEVSYRAVRMRIEASEYHFRFEVTPGILEQFVKSWAQLAVGNDDFINNWVAVERDALLDEILIGLLSREVRPDEVIEKFVAFVKRCSSGDSAVSQYFEGLADVAQQTGALTLR